ncbi:MAG: extracellular solute-binding protein [Chloroflexota bacterium]
MVQKKNLSRREFLRLSMLGAAGATLAACAPQTGSDSAASSDTDGSGGGDPVNVTYLIRSDIGQTMQDWTEVALEEFAELNPNINVETIGVPWGDYNAKLLALYAAGTPPEVSANYAAGFPTFYANDALAPLDDLVAASGANINDIEQAALDSVTREGKLWAVPLAHLPTMVYYNADLLEANGVAFPTVDSDDTSWTIDEMLAGADAIASDLDDPTKAEWGMVFGTGQLGVLSWLWGVDPFNNVGGPENTEAYQTGILTEAHYDSDGMTEFISWVRNLIYEDQVAPRPSDTDAIQQTVGWPMMSGRIGMYINGLWAVNNFKNIQPQWRWGLAVLPYGPSGVNTRPLFNDSWMLSAQAPEQEAGWSLLQYLALENGAKLYAEMSGFFPANKQNYNIWYDSTMSIPNLVLSREELETVTLGSFVHGYPTPGKTLDQYPQLNRAFNQTMGPVWNDEATPAEGLASVQETFLSIIETGTS